MITKYYKIGFGVIISMGLLYRTAMGQTAYGPCQAQTVFVYQNGQCITGSPVLVFSDDFTGNSLDKNKWMTAPPYQRYGAEDYYTDGNNYVFNHPGISLLVDNIPVYERGIPYQPDSYTLIDGSPNLRWWNYTSGMLYSKYKFGMGIYQITCQMPYPMNQGYHPNFWEYGKGDGSDNEIDACEMECDGSVAAFNTHHGVYSCPYDHTVTGADISYHTYEYDWTKGEIAFDVDGNFIAYTTRFWTILGQPVLCNELDVNANPYLLSKTFPSDNPMNIYVTCNIGKFLTANGFTGAGCNPDNVAVFPNVMKIQSIQYYEYLPCSQGPITVHESDINSLPDFFNVFTASDVTVSGNVSIPSVGALEILASNSITFSAGFTSSGYTVAKIEPNPCSGARMLNPNSSIDESTVDSDNASAENKLRNSLSNFRIFPIPASTSITFKYVLLQNENVKIDIYNVMGQKILNVINKYQNEGNYSIPVIINTLNNGVYLCHIIAGNDIKEKKIIVER